MTAVSAALREHPRHLIAAALVIALALAWRSPLWLAASLAGAVLLIAIARPHTSVTLALLAALVAGALFANVRMAALDGSQLSGLIGHAVSGEVTFAQAPRPGKFDGRR